MTPNRKSIKNITARALRKCTQFYLEMAGVDNWGGIEEAMRMFKVMKSELNNG